MPTAKRYSILLLILCISHCRRYVFNCPLMGTSVAVSWPLPVLNSCPNTTLEKTAKKWRETEKKRPHIGAAFIAFTQLCYQLSTTSIPYALYDTFRASLSSPIISTCCKIMLYIGIVDISGIITGNTFRYKMTLLLLALPTAWQLYYKFLSNSIRMLSRVRTNIWVVAVSAVLHVLLFYRSSARRYRMTATISKAQADIRYYFYRC